ncbi:uncharacterized protein TNIN_355801 [Trichonephila inaurata madagascariensis]|uniref:Uncharacterized protein n=1 Tax=Trichonephila inaurata madagascariensis TaxID=2747483 RepID=A0A8X7CFP3_9ARAC|nr:uncharacterized protein TNIN_355801 [Trichonephila inaurata madagascariensis]
MYTMRYVIDVDAARLQRFIDLYTISDVNEAFDRKKLRNFDASNLPLEKAASSSFCEKLYMYHWNNAHLKISHYQPENNGCAFENDKYHFKWFEGDQLPSYVNSIRSGGPLRKNRGPKRQLKKRELPSSSNSNCLLNKKLRQSEATLQQRETIPYHLRLRNRVTKEAGNRSSGGKMEAQGGPVRSRGE